MEYICINFSFYTFDIFIFMFSKNTIQDYKTSFKHINSILFLGEIGVIYFKKLSQKANFFTKP